MHLICGWDYKTIQREIRVSEDGEIVVTTDFHEYVHEGKLWTLNFRDTGIANNGISYVRIKTGAKKLHVVIDFGNGGDGLFKTYSGTTYNANGTLADGVKMTVFNRNPSMAVPLLATAYYNPTINVLGTVRGLRMIYGGNGGTAIGSTGTKGIESVISANSEFLISVQNLAGTAQPSSIVVEMYEE